MEQPWAHLRPIGQRSLLRWCVALVLVVLSAHVQPLAAAGPFDPAVPILLDPGFAMEDSLVAQGRTHQVSRALAAALGVTLGPFGAHRLYLGTRPRVPVIYGLTFGGFGVLVVLDLGHILFTKDLTRYQECERVFMWAKARGANGVTPP